MDVKTLVYIFIYSFIVLLNLFPLAPNNFCFFFVRGKPVLALLSHFNGSPPEWRGFDLTRVVRILDNCLQDFPNNALI